MTKTSKQGKTQSSQDLDPTLDILEQWAFAGGRTAAVWVMRVMALCWLPFRLAISLMFQAQTSFAKGAWQELRMMRQERIEALERHTKEAE